MLIQLQLEAVLDSDMPVAEQKALQREMLDVFRLKVEKTRFVSLIQWPRASCSEAVILSALG